MKSRNLFIFNLFLPILLLAAAGCHQMKLQLVDASVQKPSNVAVYFSMDDKQGNPVPGVEADEFKIYEDGKLISDHESQQTILNQEVAIERYTLLLLDMSGSVVDSGQVPLVQKAVGAFLENIGDNEQIAIYAFDGREDIVPIAKFGTRDKALERKNELLSNYEPKDPSTNLNGAIIRAVEELDKAKDDSDVPLRFGTLVIFTDGTDRAHRATADEALQAMKNSDTGTFVVGLGGEVDSTEMQRFGTDGFVHAEEEEAITQSFKDVADRINAQALRYYLLSYCSPARAGTHELTLEVQVGEDKGKLEYQFDAEGFEPECDPNDAPKFDIPQGDEEEAVEEEEKSDRRSRFKKGDDDKKDEDKKKNGKKKKKKKQGNSKGKAKGEAKAGSGDAAPPVAGY